MDVLLVLLSGLLLALSTLTVFEIRSWVNWKLAVLAGEYGHWLVLPALATAAAVWWVPSATPALAPLTTAGALGAAVLLLRPSRLAGRLAGSLPAQFDQALGPDIGGGTTRRARAFEPGRLFHLRSPRAAVRTWRYSGPLELDFYAPARGDATPRDTLAPCIVVIHGGGWDSGDQRQFEAFHHALAHAGFAVAAITYRLAPDHRWPAQHEDTSTAIAWLKSQASDLGIDAGRLILLGRSAGAQIALTWAAQAADPAVRGVVSLYGPADLEFAWNCGNLDKVLDSPRLMTQLMGAPYPEAADEYRDASAYFHVRRGAAPTLLLHGRLDPLVWHRQSARFAARLREEGLPHVHLELPWATHAFDHNVHGPGGQLALWSVLRFAQAVCGVRRATAAAV